MSFTGAADRVDVSGGFGQGETRPQAFTGLEGKGYVIGRTQDRIIEIADLSDPDTSTYVSAIIGNPNSMAAHNGSLYVFIGRDLIRFDTPFSATDTGTDVFTIDEVPRALTSDGTNLYYIHQLSTLNFLYRIDDLDGTPTVTNTGRVGDAINANIRGLVWHDGFFWGVDATTDTLRKVILSTDGSAHNLENVGSYSQFVGPITNPQGFGVVNGVGYISALDNDGSLWELRDFKFTDTIADQSWTVGTAVSVSAPATEDGETPITYAISPALPAGVTLDTSTGGISGTPTATADATDYTLTATDDNGIEATTTFSASAAASGGMADTAPAAPTDLSITVTATGATVSFTAGSDGGQAVTDTEYRIQEGATIDDDTDWTSTGETDTDFEIDSLSKGTQYAIEIRQVNSVGNGTKSSLSTFTTDATPPNAPTSLSVTVGETTADLSWTAPSDTGGESITSYEVSSDDGSNWTDTGDADLSYQITGLTANTEYDFKVRAVNAEGSGTASSTVTKTTTAAAPVVNNPPSFSESSYSFLDVAIAVNTVVGTVAATDADNDTLSYSLTGTDAGNFSIDANGQITVATELSHADTYNFNVVADDATDTTNVVVTVTAEADPAEIVVLKSPDALTLYKQALNKETTPAEAGDNDYSTWTTQTTITCDIRDDASNAQAFETIFVKGSGIDSYAVAVDGSNLGTRTVPDAIQVEDAYPEIDDISITRDGWQHDMIEISEQTGSSVVLTFSGTNIRINEVLILRKSVILNSNYANISHAKVDISSNIEESETGDETREIIVGRDRLRWMSSCALEFTFEDDNYEVFLDWIEDNPNPVVAQNPELYPWRVYKAVFPDMQHNAPYISSVIEVGNLVEFRLLENRRIGELDLILKRTFNSEDSPGKHLFFNDCVHLDNDRVTKTDGSIDYNASDNDLQTYSSETPLEFDISEGSDATKVTHIWMKSTGVTAYEIQTLVGNTWTTQETVTPTRSAYRGYDNSLEKLTTAITATSMRLAFTGSSVKIFEVMLLEHAGGLVSLSNVLPKKSDRTSVVQQTQDGEIERVETELSSRFKWQLDFSAAFGYNNTHKLEDFLDWINSNPNFTFAERPEVNPWRVYPAGFLNSGFNASFITQTVQIGELVQCQLSER